MKTDVVLQTAALVSKATNLPLSEGGSVYVRVIKNLDNGRYVVSLGGKRFELSSDVKLEEGKSFVAKIRIQDSKIFLVRELESAVQNSILENIEGRFGTDGRILNPEIVKYFEKLALFPDYINYTLFQTMKSLGMPFSASLFAKVRKLAVHFAGREREAGSAAFVLLQKGIEPTEENLLKILGDGMSHSNFGENFEDKKKMPSEKEKCEFEKNIFIELRNFFSSILEGSNFNGNKEGLLALFNHSGFRKNSDANSGTWIKVPLEFDFDSSGKKITLKGEMNFFILSESLKAEKCAVKIDFFEKTYRFVLSLKERKIFVNEEFDVAALKKDFPDMDFEYDSCETDGFFSRYEKPLKIVDGWA